MVTKRIQYMCRYCGRKETLNVKSGRPMPGVCPRKGKTRDGRTQPHTWVINRRYDY